MEKSRLRISVSQIPKLVNALKSDPTVATVKTIQSDNVTSEILIRMKEDALFMIFLFPISEFDGDCSELGLTGMGKGGQRMFSIISSHCETIPRPWIAWIITVLCQPILIAFHCFYFLFVKSKKRDRESFDKAIEHFESL